MDSRLFYHLASSGSDDTNHYEWLFIEDQLQHTNQTPLFIFTCTQHAPLEATRFNLGKKYQQLDR